MHKPIKYLEKAMSIAANGAWRIFCLSNGLVPENPSFTPKWSDKPLLKSREKSKPPLGWPRETDSLCPRCVPEIRKQIVDGKQDYRVLVTEKPGEIKAQIIERDGRILMVKDCPLHGHFEDVIAIDPQFFRHLEEMFPGRDIRAHNDEKLHNHGSSTIKHGRGSVLTIDLTNRCNMMCDPCFMDANQVGFVHELTWDDIKTLLDNAFSIKPRRQMSVQFSGGEPTMSPYFLDAIRYARELGYDSVQAATNGIEFAKSPEFARQAAEAGLRYAYLQFDGIGNPANSHRNVGNLFDLKLRAIENLHSNGVEVVLVTTVVNGINNEQVGRVVRFALDNPDKIAFVSFQPVSFTGRDEAITEERRKAQRYTLSHLAHDVKAQLGIGEPARDWFPLSFLSTFSDWADLVHGPDAAWGQVACGCHPNCGVGMAMMVAKDIARINDWARSRWISVAGMALAFVRNYDALQAPRHFRAVDMLRKFDKGLGATGRDYGDVSGKRTMADILRRRRDRWNLLFVACMWFQDLFNYDFRRTEQCIIPYATQEGEISFCAYNTGMGWRNIIEKMHMTASLTKWYEEHGRHEIFAGGKSVKLSSTEHHLVLKDEIVTNEAQHDLEQLGIAKNAREEKLRARAERLKQDAENLRMAKLYREFVLKERAVPELVQIGLGASTAPAEGNREAAGGCGD